MNKVAFIIPGFFDSPKSKKYQVIGKFFQTKSIKPIYVNVQWKHSTISENTEEFLKLFRSTQASHKYILGFSFGAIIAFLVAAQENVDAVLLCSLSPYFSEDLPHTKESWKKSIGKNRVGDFKKISIKNIAPQIEAETYLFFGTNEHSTVEKRVSHAYSLLHSKKHLIRVEGAKHDLADEDYLKEVKRIISNL